MCILGALLSLSPATMQGAATLQGLDAWKAAWPVDAPLDVEWLGSVQEDGVEVRAFRFTGSVAGGKPQRIYALFGVPEKASTSKKVPGIVQIHGGGQTCEAANVAWFVNHGYACVAFDWGGPRDGRTTETTTDWNDGISKNFVDRPPGGVSEVFIFHGVLAARRAVDFLQSRPEVDAGRIGVQGISWGGLMAWVSAAVEDRIKAVVPVYGAGGMDRTDNSTGASLRRRGEDWLAEWSATFDPVHLAPEIEVPLLFCNGSNDWFGALAVSEEALGRLKVAHARSYAANRNHNLDAGNVQAAMDWFDCHLKSERPVMREPEMTLVANRDGKLSASIKADPSASHVRLLTARGAMPDVVRCWLRSPTKRGSDGSWLVEVPVWSVHEPVSLIAEVEQPDGSLVHSKVVFDLVPSTIPGVKEPESAPAADARIAEAGDTDAWIARTTTDFPGCSVDTGVTKLDIGRRAGVRAAGGFRPLMTRRPADPGVARPAAGALVLEIWTHDFETLEVELNENSSRLDGVAAFRAAVRPGQGWVRTVLRPEDFKPVEEGGGDEQATLGRVYDITVSGQETAPGRGCVGEVSWMGEKANQ